MHFDTQKIHKGGFYHDGRFGTLSDVVNHYDRTFKLGLTEQEKNDLIELLEEVGPIFGKGNVRLSGALQMISAYLFIS